MEVAKSFTASGPWQHRNTAGNLSEQYIENHLLQAWMFSASAPSCIILSVVVLEGKSYWQYLKAQASLIGSSLPASVQEKYSVLYNLCREPCT